MTTTLKPLAPLPTAEARVTLCVLCERTTLVPVPWQGGASYCCRHCFRAQRRAWK